MRQSLNNKGSRVADMNRVSPGGANRDQRFTHGQPVLGQRAREIQPYGEISRRLPVGLDENVRRASVEALNQTLADTIVLRDMYKKHHWQVSGPTFYSLHLLFDKHYQEQAELVDMIAERIQSLGGVSIAVKDLAASARRWRRQHRDATRCLRDDETFASSTRTRGSPRANFAFARRASNDFGRSA